MCTPHYGTSVVLLKHSQTLLPYEGHVLSLLSQEKLRRGGQRDSHKSTWLAREAGLEVTCFNLLAKTWDV